MCVFYDEFFQTEATKDYICGVMQYHNIYNTSYGLVNKQGYPPLMGYSTNWERSRKSTSTRCNPDCWATRYQTSLRTSPRSRWDAL